MPSIESRVEAGWIAKQTARGAPAAAAIKRIRKVGGDAATARADANQNWSDGGRYVTAEDYVDTLVGNGSPQMQGQAGVLAYLLYLMNGQETVTAVPGAAGLWDHVGTPGGTSFWFTWWKKVGEVVGPVREKFNDCRYSSLRIEGSSGQKVINATASFVSLDPGEVYAVDPVQAEDTDRSLIYTEGEGRFKINGAVFRAHSQFAFIMNDATTPWYGDSPRAQDVGFSASTVDIEGVTLLVDQQGKDYYDEQIYGTTAPAAGTKPRTDLPFYGSYEVDLKRGTVIDISIVGATGNFTVTVDGQTTANIVHTATAAAVQSALEALTNVVVGDVAVTGGPGNATPWRIIFVRAGRTVTATFTGLTGGTPTSTDRGPEKRLYVEFPTVKWTPDLAIAGNPDGGPVEIALGAQTRKGATEPHIRTTVRCGDAAYT